MRVQISRLREKLKQYYETEAPAAAWRVEIPVGQHHPQFRPVPAPPEAPVEAFHPTPPRWNWRRMAVGLVIAALALSSVWLLAVNRRLQLEARQRPAPPRFWQDFFADGKPARLVFPTPVFYQFSNGSLRVRDFLVNEFDDYAKSPALTELVNKWGQPTLSQSYSVTTDTRGALRLTQHLTTLAFPLAVGGPGDLPLEEFGNHHIIFLGIPATNAHIDEYLKQTNFHFQEGTDSLVINRQPLPGEPEQFLGSAQSGQRRTRPGIIALLPGKAAGTKLLVLAGDTSSLVACLIASPSLDLLETQWRKHNSPAWFEAVLMPEVEGEKMLRVQPVAFRAFQPPNR
ncbi:MAG: hypothetical protein ACREEM_15055 [Blastocatellia bacterium]